MSQRKRARAAKAQAPSKVRPKAARSGEHNRRANSKQARVLGAAAPAERRHHRGDHDLHRLAAAHGAGVFCRRGAQEAGAEARVREDRRRARVSDCCRQDVRRPRG
jgi:hypothetical protein